MTTAYDEVASLEAGLDALDATPAVRERWSTRLRRSVLPPVVFERSGMLSGCICVLLDWDDDRKTFVNRLRQLGVPVIVFVLRDPKLDQSIDESGVDGVHFLRVGQIQQDLFAAL